MARAPAVAGTFYDASGPELVARVRSLIGPLPQNGREDVVGAVCPHAAYDYSGKVAGKVFASIVVPDVVIVLAPNHTGLGELAAVGVDSPWVMPDGEVEVDADLAWRVIKACPDLEPDDLAHVREHAIEVQLPFLRAVNPAVRIVPVCLRTMSYQMCEAIGAGIARAVEGMSDRVLLLASSDLSHHEPLRVATRKDRMVIDRVREMDARGLYSTVVEHHVTMCGMVPVVAMLLAARALGARYGRLISYATTDDITGDESSVISYAGLVVARGRPPNILKSFSD